MHRFESGRRLIFMKILRLYSSIIGSLSRKRWVVAFLPLLLLLFNMVIFPSIMARGNLQPHDIMLHYPAGDLIEYVQGMSPSQKTFSLVFHTTADIIYPVLYTILLSILLFLTSGKNKGYQYSQTNFGLTSLPLTIFFFDLLENAGMIILVTLSKSETPLPEVLFSLTAAATIIKWIFAGITILILGFTFLSYLFRKFKNHS